MKRRRVPVRQRILELLADGKPHRSIDIAHELHERHGFAVVYVQTALSFFASYRTVERRWDGKYWVYRRLDAECAA